MARFNRSVPIVVLSVLFAGIMVAFAYAAADDAPATTKATTTTTAESSKPADVAADAAPLLAKLANAYKNLKTLDLAGTLSGDFDIDGEKNNQKVDVTGSYAAPNQFRHALKNELLVGSTGEQFYIFEERAKLYKTSEAKTQKVPTADLPDPFGRILLDQNLSLAFALSSDPAAELGQMYEKIAKAPDVTIDGKAHPALALSNEHGSATLALDPQTNLIRRMTIDMAKAVKQRGAQEVAKALVTMDYPTSTPGATTKPAQFAWAPPPGARDVATIQTPREGELPALAMVGKPAPAFKLKDLNGKDVSLTDLKGNVLVFDFWATWCPPCVASMPGLNHLAEEMKDKGVKVVAIDQDEEKELVQGFINSRKLNSLIVLLDPDTTMSKEYMGNELLPTTMVIGKDGTIRKVITTGGSQAEKDLKEAVEEALRATK